MISKIRIIFILFILSQITCSAQSKFSKQFSFSKKGSFEGGLVEINSDKSLIIAGSRLFTSNNINNESEGAIFLLKTDKNGLPLWIKDYSISGFPYMRFHKLVNNWNDSILFLAYSITRVPIIGTLEDHSFLGKMDTAGNIGIVKEFHFTGSDFIRNVHIAKDSGYFICGITSTNYQTWDTSSNRPPSNTYLMRLDKKMNQLWCRKYGDSTYFFADASTQLADEGFIIAGRTTVLSDTTKLCIMRTDSLGNVIWCKVEQSATEVVGGSMHIAIGKDSSIAIAYDSDSPILPFNDISFLKLDLNGNLIWHRLQGDQGGDFVKGLVPTSDSGYILMTGNLLRFYDSLGNILFAKRINPGYPTNFYNLLETKQNDLILVGAEASSVTKPAMERIDSTGISCLNSPYTNLSSIPTAFAMTVWNIKDTLISMIDSLRTMSFVIDTLPGQNYLCATNQIQQKARIDNELYPNPCEGIVFIKLAQSIQAIEIYSIDGLFKSSYLVNNKTSCDLDLTSLNSGLYVLVIRTQKEILIKKISKI